MFMYMCACVCMCLCAVRGGWFSGVTFRNDTAAAEDLQQVVFKFPEFNKLPSRESTYSYENSVKAIGPRGVPACVPIVIRSPGIYLIERCACL